MTESFLVTGGSGFLGTWVIKDLLAHGHSVVVYDIQDGGERWDSLLGPAKGQVDFVAGDILDAVELGRVLDEKRISRVIHLAAWLTPQCQDDPYRGCEINVLGTQGLFELARARPGQIKGLSYASSVAVYGRDAHEISATEDGRLSDDALRPETFYGAFKLANELTAKQYWLHHGIPSVGLRSSLIYGPGREHGLTAASTLATRAVAHGEKFTFDYSGRTGYEFVADVARAFVRAALEITDGAYIVDLPGIPKDVREIIEILDGITSGAASLLTVDGPPLPYPVSPYQVRPEQLFSDWTTTSLEDGFAQTFEYYSR